jgi:hypothetical protein
MDQSLLLSIAGLLIAVVVAVARAHRRGIGSNLR